MYDRDVAGVWVQGGWAVGYSSRWYGATGNGREGNRKGGFGSTGKVVKDHIVGTESSFDS